MFISNSFNALIHKHSSFISEIFYSYRNFYKHVEQFNWMPMWNDINVDIIASCNRKSNIISINPASVDHAFQINEPLQIEYFVLHEMRHAYQNLEIKKYKEDPSKCVNAELAKRWMEEQDTYVPPLNANGEQNLNYYKQSLEFDAYAYAYSIMKYKYGDIPYILPPKSYQNGELKEEFDITIDKWIKAFEEGKL